MKPTRILERLRRDIRIESRSATTLMAREGSGQEIADCVSLHRSLEIPYGASESRILPEMWRTLLSRGALRLFLVEGRAKGRNVRIISSWVAVFVTDAFCSEAQTSLPPFLGIQLTRCFLSGRLPLLSRGAVARANARDGLNLVVCFEGWEQGNLSREEFFAVREKQSEALRLALSGYRIKEFLANPIGKEAFEQMVDAGANLRRDYSDYFRRNNVPMPESSRRPRLVGLRRDEAVAHLGTHLAGLFVYTSPRFRFNRSEQALLRHALLGETSDGLAASLFVSHSTVKKRWQAIYEKVADVDPELLGGIIGNGIDGAKRGAEHRRHLLYYLRQHPEELRPFDSKKAAITRMEDAIVRSGCRDLGKRSQ